MPISFPRSAFAGSGLLLPASLLCLLISSASVAVGQDQTAPPTPLMKQLSRFDLSLVASGELSTRVGGIEQRDADTTHTELSIKPTSTVGELATLRYIAKPYVGFEFNFGNLRFNQAGVHEITLGYVAHPPSWKFYGIQPYLGAGGGTIRFHPTPGGGQGLPFQYRAAYYYNLGLEDYFPNTSNFGMRVGFRQLIYLAPDFLQNYLTITRRTRTSEPVVGFFLRF